MNDLDRYQLRNAMTPLLQEAFKYYGIKEVPGKGSNPIILGMAKTLGVDNIYKDDDTAWCALFMCFILKNLSYPKLQVVSFFDFFSLDQLLDLKSFHHK